jgi:hypothetical protein
MSITSLLARVRSAADEPPGLRLPGRTYSTTEVRGRGAALG